MTDKVLTEQKPIEGKVVGVLTERELIINVGSSSGVRHGMRFKVLSNQPTEVRDPETNDLLGVIDREKVRVQASEVEEKYTICKTYRVFVTGGPNMPNIAEAMAALGSFGSTPRKEVPETLKAEDQDTFPPLSEEESYVKKGDRVIQVST